MSALYLWALLAKQPYTQPTYTPIKPMPVVMAPMRARPAGNGRKR
jgi:hypothetical protein